MRMTQPIGELTDRMREIFGHVVEAYLERGLPIGSKALAGSVNLSPASIRGVMQDLEERGLLTHPHTSAGRIPTDRAYRVYVNEIMRLAPPTREARHTLQAELLGSRNAVEESPRRSDARARIRHASGR